MRLPNGYGSVSKLPGKRRRPWRVRRTLGWEITPDGKNRQKTQNIGFYATKAEALAALAAFNADPYSSDVTFAQVYDAAMERKFAAISESNAKKYRAAFKMCSAIHDARFSDLRLSTYQKIADESGKSANSLVAFKAMLSAMYEYAVVNGIVGRDRDAVSYLNIGVRVKSDKHYRFTDDEVAIMRRWAPKNDTVKVMLMLIYSGVRPGELFALKTADVDLAERFFRVRDGKNENAKRIVPIHPSTLAYFADFAGRGTEYLIVKANGKPVDFQNRHTAWTESYWYPVLRDMGILEYRNAAGELRNHLPDDTRHTFTTKWTEQKLDEIFRRRIQGHSGKGIGEQVYTHLDIAALRDELDRLE